MRKKIDDLLYGIKYGFLAAFIPMLLSCIVLSVIMSIVSLPKLIIDFAACIFLSAFCYISAYISTQVNRHDGLKQGALCGGIVTVVILVICMLSNGYISDFCIVKSISCMLAGIIGGIKGVNTKLTRKR